MNGASSRVYVLLIALLTACAAEPIRMPVPANLVPGGEREVERLVARGVQTYECRAKPGDAASAGWIYVAADLEMLDAAGGAVGRHTFAPAVWEAPDGSKLIGEIRARADAPQTGNGQWLLVSTRSVGAEGRFSKITSLQRLNTRGGVAPLHDCDPKRLGAKERVPLIAEFVLFTK
jgi:hypothetical protein